MYKCIVAWYTEKDTKQSQVSFPVCFWERQLHQRVHDMKIQYFPLVCESHHFGQFGGLGEVVVKIILVSSWRITSMPCLKKNKHYQQIKISKERGKIQSFVPIQWTVCFGVRWQQKVENYALTSANFLYSKGTDSEGFRTILLVPILIHIFHISCKQDIE